MNEIHLVVGAGTVGGALAELLADDGKEVILATRSGSGPKHSNIKLVSADASNVTSLLAAAPSAAAIYNCVNPGAVLVTCSNLYGYGPVDVPMTESLPLNATGVNGKVRANMWIEAKAMHDAGIIKATEVRGSDYVSASDQSRVGARVLPKVLAGKPAQVLGAIDLKHTWTYPLDVARLMKIVASDSRAWGKAWHVPSNEAKTQNEVVSELASAAGVSNPKLSSVPTAIWNLIALFNPLMRALKETAYQMQRPYILEDSAARQTFGMQPTPWNQILNEVVTETKASLKK